MLEEKKPRGSLQQGSEDAGQPKTPKINTGARNSATGNTDRISKSNNNIKPAHRFALLSERCAPSAPGPLPSPLLGGLPGSSLLIAQQAASLRLAQLKAQLALTQINNALAVGSQAATFTANCNTPAPYISTKPPSPTAAAINLLNVLKIANTMSHPMYNPYASGNQSSTQGQYGHPSMQAERDQRRSSCLAPGSNFGSTGGSSLIPDTSGGIPSSSLSSQSMNYRPEQGRAIMDKELERSIDMHISRAREEVRVLGKPVHHPLDQDTRFTNTQRHEFHSPGTGMVSYPSLSSTSAAPGHRHSDIESGGTSLDWSSNYKRPTADDSKFYSSSVSSNNASGRDDRFFPPIERPRDMQSIPGLGDYDRPVPESTRPKYTSESAASILMHFGLQKEDLEELLSYPEDQITPANLPYILRQIRIQKTKRTPTTVQTKSYPESPSKVIEYGHTGKYTGGVVDDTGKTSVSRANSGGSGANPVPPTPLLSNITDASRPMQRMMFLPDDPRSRVIPPLLPQTIQNFNHMTLPPSSRQPPAKVAVTKGLPTLAMMHDYAAASPRIFPHTCSLCNKECTHMKDWLSHQNTNLHLESCRLLRNRAAAKDAKPQAVSSAQTSQQRHQKTSRGSHSHSRSRSPSPRRHRGSEGRRERRSLVRVLPPHGMTTQPLPAFGHVQEALRDNCRQKREKRDGPQQGGIMTDDHLLGGMMGDGRQGGVTRDDHHQGEAMRGDRLQRRHPLSERTVQSLSKQTDLDTVVKTLAPVLLAELVKMKSTSSSSSSASSKGGKPSSSTTPAGGKRPSSTGSSSSTSSTAKKKVLLTKGSKAKPSLQKSEASSSTKTKSSKSSPPTMVRLEGIRSSLSHKDVIAAMEQFGKTKSVLLFRSKLEAIVCFEKEEDAKKLRGVKSLDVKGLPVNVIREKQTCIIQCLWTSNHFSHKNHYQ
ncbi:Zinc finger protein 638 [Collichthys lucidus]|uniref:Zinc finger protein 638 n=1 Tax=Collichthys lucidus TaxID=240159 RepID=A0A4U5VZL6_COLLU|nr:Zinc finger protein 638 [Collichthys lucidus]